MNYAQIVEICCRDLRRYLETALVNTRGGVVAVKMRRLLRAELPRPDHIRYSICLSRILRQWRWGDAYVIPRQDAEKLLEAFDAVCESVKARRREPPQAEPRLKEVVKVTFCLPPQLLHVLDEYARERGMTRSDAVRHAVHLLISKYSGAEERVEDACAEQHEKPLTRVTFHLPRSLKDALDEYAAALQTARASIVRYAVARMLRHIHAQAAP
jgi:hypothetical protein